MSKSERRERNDSILSPLPSLAKFIASEQGSDEWIAFPQDTEGAVKAYQSLGRMFPKGEIKQLVQAFNVHDYQFCSRLDGLSLTVLCSIVTHSEPCGARYRVYHLIAEAIHPSSRDSQASIDHKYINKSALRNLLPRLLEMLTRGSEEEEPRRWMSLLVLELLEGCPENFQFLMSNQGTDWQGLTRVMKDCECEMLRILTGSIIRQMLSAGVKPDILWTAEDATAWVPGFPVTPEQNPPWINRFEDHMKSMVTLNLLPRKKSYETFAHAMIIGNHRYAIENESAIFVSVSSQALQILVRAAPFDLATQIQIPLLNIVSHEVASITPIHNGNSMYTNQIRLSGSSDVSLFINASEHYERDVGISFDSHGAAAGLSRILRAGIAKESAVERSAHLAENTAKKGRKKKVIEESQEVSDIARRSQVPAMANQNVDDNDHTVAEERNQPSLTQRMTLSEKSNDMRAIAAGATSLLNASQQASASARQPVFNTQGASQSRRWKGSKRSESNENAMLVIPDSLEPNTGTDMHMANAQNPKASQMLPRGGSLTHMERAEEGSYSLDLASESMHGDVLQAKARRTSSAHPKTYGTKSEGPKRQKLSQQPRDDHGEVSNSGQSEGKPKPRDAFPRMTASKSLNSRLSTKSKTITSRKQLGDLRDIKGKQIKETQSKGTIGPDQDPYDIPMSPVPPKKDASGNRATRPSTGKSSNSKKKSAVANKAQTQKNPAQEQNAHIQAPKPLVQLRSRRAAAIHANERIQGIDNSTPRSPAEGKQGDTNKLRVVYDHSKKIGAKAEIAAQNDSIQTVQTADEIVSVKPAFVQDSIETVKSGDEGPSVAKGGAQESIEIDNNANKTLSTKKTVQNSIDDGKRAEPRTIAFDNEVRTTHFEIRQGTHKQAREDPKTADEEQYLALDPGEEVPDPVQEKNLETIPFNLNGRGAANHVVRGAEAKEVSRQQTLIELSGKAPNAQEIVPNEEMRDDQVLNGSPFKDGGPSPLSKQRSADSGFHMLPKDAEGAVVLNALENGQASKNDTNTPKAVNNPDVHDSPVSRDPFSAKLSKVVMGKDITEENHSTLNIDPPKSKDGSGNQQETPKKSSRHILLQEGQRIVERPDPGYLDIHLRKPAVRPKRTANGELRNIPKKPRIDVHGVDGTTDKSAKKTPPIASGKTSIISFSASGPRNQGTANKKAGKKPGSQAGETKRDRFSGVVENTTDDSEITSAAIVPLREPQQSIPRETDALRSEDGYTALDDGEPMAFENEVQEPHEQHQHQSLQQVKFDRLDTKPSSQTTRVNHNGSPMPVRHPTNEHALVSANDSKLKDSEYQMSQYGQDLRYAEEGTSSESEEDNEYADEEDQGKEHEKILEPTLPSRKVASQATMPQIGAFHWTSIAKNSKQVPSSPHDPSATAALSPHHIHHGGQIINASTNKPIVPSIPQDPFVAHAAMPSSFMRLLQNADKKYTKQGPGAVMDERPKKVRISAVLTPNDPEKILAKPPLHRSKEFDESKRVTSSTSSEDTSEEEDSRTLIEETVNDTPTQWKKALLPHRNNTLEILNEISHHLLAHMIKGEDAFLDLVQDFKNSGNKLINHLEKELQEELVARAAATSALEKKMIDLFQNTMADLKDNEGQWVGRTSQVENELNAHRQSLLASTEAALALCKN